MVNADMNSLQSRKQCQFNELYKGQCHISLSGWDEFHLEIKFYFILI